MSNRAQRIECDGYLWSNEQTIQLWAYFYAGNEVPPDVTSCDKLRQWYWMTATVPSIKHGDKALADHAWNRYQCINFHEVWEVINPNK